MNTYKKYYTNVFIAVCEEQHEKNDIIILTTKYGKENECIVHNFLGKNTEGKFCYSITRADGYNAQERATRKAEQMKGWARNAENRSNEAYEKADLSEEKSGIPFGQPILVGHHSEKRHRKTIERANRQMDKCVEESRKAEDYESRANWWEEQAKVINLSMPESLEFFAEKLKAEVAHHKYLLENKTERPHVMALSYANRRVKETKKRLEIAERLWK